MGLIDEPLLSQVVDRDTFQCMQGAAYVFGSNPEQRSALSPEWAAREAALGTELVEIVDQTAYSFELASGGAVQLQSASQIRSVVSRYSGRALYLDVTGLTHACWAPILRAAIEVHDGPFFVVYQEPTEYSARKEPRPGFLYDLSEGTEGIRPIPGFSLLRRGLHDSEILVPLLGFEGSRFARVLDHAQPSRGQVFPVVGFPGFRADYPFTTYFGNQAHLEAEGRFASVHYAAANDPFALFQVLRILAEENPGALMRIAPIGTKPHGVGAVLFALSGGTSVELIYDHPRRKAGRTTGRGALCVADVGLFRGSDLFQWRGDMAAGMLQY